MYSETLGPKQDTYIIEVDVGSSVVGEDKVADGVCALDAVVVVVKGV